MRKLLHTGAVMLMRRPVLVTPPKRFCMRQDISTSHNLFFCTPVSTLSVKEDYRFNALAKKVGDLKIRPEDLVKCVSESPELLEYPAFQWEKCFSALRYQGFYKEDCLNMIVKCPSLLKIKHKDLENTLSCWRLSQIGDKDMLSLLRSWPHFLLLSDVKTSDRLRELKTYCSWKSVVELLKNCPNLLVEDMDDIDEKIEYLEEVMNIERSKIIKSCALNHSLLFLKTRHVCLERCGKYVRPRKKDDPNFLNTNPPLHLITDTDDHYFAKKVAGLTLEEYEVFQNLYELEFQDAVDQEYESGSDSDSE